VLRLYDVSYKTYFHHTKLVNQMISIDKIVNRVNTKTLYLSFGLVIFLLFSLNSYAHKVNMFAYGEGEQVFLEGYFADGKKAQNSEVVVVDDAGKEIARGTTDDQGQFSFEYPSGTDLVITLDAGMGHKTEYKITESELSDDEDSGEEESSSSSAKNEQVPAQMSNAAPMIDTKLMRTEIEKAVGKAIKPLMREISEMREEKSFAEIIGGIGFIFGGLGIFMYYKARKMEQKSE